MFVVKRGEYFRKYNIFEVYFDPKVCISMGCIHKKESMTSHPSFILQTSIFVQKSLKMGQNGPLYREICHNPIQGSCTLQRYELSEYVINYWTLLRVEIKDPNP